MLKEAVATEKAKGGFDDISEPMVVCSPRRSRPEPLEEDCAGQPFYWASL